MRNTKGQFQLGHSGGRPKGARNKLAAQVFEDILHHWCEPAAPGSKLCKGVEALETLYKEKPGEYLRLTASVLPREFIFENVTSDLDDEQIDELLLTLRQRMIEARTAPALPASPVADGVGNEPEPRHWSLPPEKVEAAISRLEAMKAQRAAENKLAHYRPYPKQVAFHTAGARCRERLLIAANQSGKSLAGAMECAMHATGRYPDWWKGRRFHKPTIDRHAPGNVPEFDAVEQIGCAAGRNQINDGIFRNGCRARLAWPTDKDSLHRWLAK
jgi:hypothetical protein